MFDLGNQNIKHLWYDISQMTWPYWFVGDGKGNEIPSLNTWISDQIQISKMKSTYWSVQAFSF